MGAASAHGTLVAFCDVDLRVSSRFLAPVAALFCGIRIGALQEAILHGALPISHRGWYKRVHESSTPETRVLEFLLRWLNGDKESVQLLAPSTSFLVVDRLHYLSLGGHSLEFAGHGFEDFEFHHRLATEANRFHRPEDYYRDYGDWEMPEYRGFRSLFSLAGREALYANLIAIHLWHPRPRASGFYRARAENQVRLSEVMRAFDSRSTRPSPLVASEVHDTKFLFFGHAGSSKAETLRDVFPLLGAPFYVDDETLSSSGQFFDARRCGESLDKHGISRVLFPNPYRNTVRRDLYQWCRAEKFPYVVFERGALPNSWFFDAQGFNADSGSYSRCHWDRVLSKCERDEVQGYIDWCLAGHETLEKQGDRLGAEALARRLGVVGKKVLFVPLQRPSDTVTVHMAGAAGGVSKFVAFIDESPSG